MQRQAAAAAAIVSGVLRRGVDSAGASAAACARVAPDCAAPSLHNGNRRARAYPTEGYRCRCRRRPPRTDHRRPPRAQTRTRTPHAAPPASSESPSLHCQVDACSPRAPRAPCCAPRSTARRRPRRRRRAAAAPRVQPRATWSSRPSAPRARASVVSWSALEKATFPFWVLSEKK